ncbi:hypothetical protein BGW36DRAFT_407418 [Talaromyces proteolyticus]|uniref:Uncharacterized protein n=1 Tax=Talaromyces proteolyticus TaxID=1131652 RepID=A0AAD4PY53_9EURO|nr:uncharacterized protein BGW36DRAFT_407418 [Talaromyces proteolyticus]KAH8697379.1 hypothetical protein BGW36DRAFT_407418 [Talaromyces proteolyticus]
MAGFPSLKPAFTIQVKIDPPFSVGSHHRKTGLDVVPMIGGTVKAESDFAPSLNATFVGTGNDYIRADPDQKRLRLDAHSVLKTHDDALIYVSYTGTVNLSEDSAKILAGAAGDLATDFGDSFTQFHFETGDERYKDLENGVFVGQGRFISKTGEKVIVEYKVSQAVLG